MKNNEIVRRLLLANIIKSPNALVADLLTEVQKDVDFEVQEKDIKAGLKWLTRNGYIQTEQAQGYQGRFGSADRKVLRQFS